MCGIAGIFRPAHVRNRDGSVAAMMGLMHHRGPDGDGRYTSPSGLYEAGFRRLSIIDLKTGDQPLTNPQGTRVLVGNGEIYNYLELRRQYADYPFRTRGDMETVLAAHAHDGDDFLMALNGMFALALYDTQAHGLTLVRDRLGVKPLYYARGAGDAIVFASEIKPLFASGLVQPEIDEAAVSAYLAHGFVPGAETLFKGVKKLRPGHLAKVNSTGDLTVERYWRAEGGVRLPKDADGIAEALTALLEDSVRLQMRSDVPVGALLSGGLDSGLIVALGAEHADGALNTFTVSFEGAAVDEAPLARLVAEKYATRHEEIRLSADNVSSHLPLLAWHAEEPLADAALLPNYLVERALGQRIKVALNGTGGDELFAGYGRYFQLPVEHAYLTVPAMLRRHIIEPAWRMAAPMKAWQLARAEKFDGDPGGYSHDHGCQFPAPLRHMIGNHLPEPVPAQRAFANEFDGDRQAQSLYGDVNTYLPDDLLTLLDRTSMAVSVEGRVPFLDHRLVEAALSVPSEIRAPGQSQKWLERKMAAAYLPDAILSAPKQGFASPVPAWMAGDLGKLADDLLTRPEALARGWWTRDGITRLTRDPTRHGFRTYSLLMLELSIIMMVERPITDHAPSEHLSEIAHAA